VLEPVYERSPVAIQNLLVTGYGILLYFRRIGSRFHKTEVRRIASVEHASADQLRGMQDGALRDLLGHAAQTVPHYRDSFSRHGIDPSKIRNVGDLQRLPIVEKEDVRKLPEQFWSTGTPRSYTINTSGTTGSPLRVRCSRRALLRNYAHYYRLRERLGIGIRDRSATFGGRTIVEPERSEPPFWRHNLAHNNILYSTYHLSDNSIPAYLDRLARQRPALIFSYPSALTAVARGLLRQSDFRIRPRAIIASCETLLPHQRAVAEEAFGCTITDFYGSAEMSAFVAQCERGTYHVWPTYGICEVLVGGRPARPGEAGDLVTTSFVNDAMPLLRYRTGDVAVAGHGCPCGLAFPTLHGIEGRRDDVLVTPDGRQVGRLDPAFKGLADDVFHEAQIVQTALDCVVLRYVAGTRFDPTAVEKVSQELRNRLGPTVQVRAEAVRALPRGPNGKLRAVVGFQREAGAAGEIGPVSWADPGPV
jgi:phenylacetate-CoA ligase